MEKFDVYAIDGALYLVVQTDHLLTLNTVILVPVLPHDSFPPLSKLTVDVEIGDAPFTIRAHMPLTVEAQRLRALSPVHRLTADQGQAVMDGLATVLWGF